MQAELVGPDGRHIPLSSTIITIGRASDNILVLDEPPTISRYHAEIRPQGEGYVIVDITNKNTTFVNQEQLEHNVPHYLKSGDIIHIRGKSITYYDDASTTRSPVEVPTTKYPESQNTQQEYVPPNPSPPPAKASNPQSNTGALGSQNLATAELQFTAFYPKFVSIGTWQTLLVYAYIASAIRKVYTDAERFNEQWGSYRSDTSTQSKLSVPRGSEITVVPTCDGVTFSPGKFHFKWTQDWHPIVFQFISDTHTVEGLKEAQITVYIGPLIAASLEMRLLFEHQVVNNIPIALKQQKIEPQSMHTVQEVTASRYQKVFVSYSHKDHTIIRAFQAENKSLGNEVYIDREKLRSGQYWSDALLRMIDNVDVFQLFWSSRAAQSPYVEQEWRHALQRQESFDHGEGFIRPVYWEEPQVPPPTELQRLHFQYVEIKRSFIQKLFNGF